MIEGIYDPRTGGTTPDHETGVLRRDESWTFEVIPAQELVDGGHKLDRGGTTTTRIYIGKFRSVILAALSQAHQ